jgi:hypothetical protein
MACGFKCCTKPNRVIRNLERIAIEFTGKWRDLRYGTGSVSDLSIDQKTY